MDGSVASVTLVVTTILSPPFTYLKQSSDGHSDFEGNDRFEGYIPDLIQKMSELVGFDYELSLVPDGRYGSPDRNGEWNGMINELINRRADIAAADLTISYLRNQVVDFTQPFMHSRLTMLSQKPERSFDADGCPAFSESFETFDELASQTEVRYGVVYGGSTMSFFRNSMMETYSRMWDSMNSAIPTVFVNSTTEGVGRVMAGNYVYITESPILEFIANRMCELQVRGYAGPENGFGLAFRRNLQPGDKINKAIILLRESGFLDRLKLKWWGYGHCG